MRYGCNRYEPTFETTMTPSNAILAAHALPFQRVGEALRAFWPLVAFWVLGFFVSANIAGGLVDTNVGGFFLLAFFVFIYVALLSARGAVQWHRMMILGEPVRWTVPLPNGASFRYFGVGLGVGLVFGIVYVVASLIVIGPLFALIAGPTDAGDPNGVRLVGIVFQVIAFALYAGVLALLAGLILALPSSAVGDAERPTPNGAVRRILIGTALPVAFVVAIIGTLAGPVLPTLLAAVLTALNIYGSLVALTGLSIAYRAAD